MSLSRIRAIIFKEFIHIKRDKTTLGIIFAFPVVMMLMFGYAVSTDVDNMSTVVFNLDKKTESRTFISKLEQSSYFKVEAYVNSDKELQYFIDRGRAKIGLVFPPDFSKKILKGTQAQVQIILDGSDPSVARTALFTAGVIAQNHSSEILISQMKNRGISSNINIPLDLRSRVWYNPDMKSINYNIPGLIGLVLQNITVLLTAFALVRERDKGTLEQLIVTPVKPTELIIGKIIPYIFVAFIDVALTLAVGTIWFKVKVAGSVLELFLLSGIFLVSALGIGLFISTIAKNQLQAMQMSFAIILPSMILSGFIFPREAMPTIIYYLGYLIPLTYLLEILRGIILKGVGLNYLWNVTLLLTIFGGLVLTLASKRFRKTLD